MFRYLGRLMPLAVLASIGLSTVAWGQDRVRGHVLLPYSHGATVLSTRLHAQAARLVAMGDFMESAAIARKINLQSDRIAMENSILWVETYFERRKLNQEYRDELRRDYSERSLEISRERHQRVLKSDPSGEPSDEINYMIDRLVADPDAYQSIAIGDVPAIDAIDFTLTPTELTHVMLKDTGGSQGARPFRPTDPKLIDEQWPKVFQLSEFDDLRPRYDQARDAAIIEIEQRGKLSIETLGHVQRELNALKKRFDEVYIWPEMEEQFPLATYSQLRQMGENFLRTQAAGTFRAFAMNDPRSYAATMRFDGENLVDLIRFCAEKNVRFAKPTPGDEPTYQRLFKHTRALYMHYVPDTPDF